MLALLRCYIPMWPGAEPFLVPRRSIWSSARLLLIALGVIAILVAIDAVAILAMAQEGPADAVANDLCANNGALIHWAWAAAGSTPAIASAMAAIAVFLRRYVPAPLAKLLYALSLNWLKDLADRAAKASSAGVEPPRQPSPPA